MSTTSTTTAPAETALAECSLSGCGRHAAFRVTAGPKLMHWACNFHLANQVRRVLVERGGTAPQAVVTAMVAP